MDSSGENAMIDCTGRAVTNQGLAGAVPRARPTSLNLPLNLLSESHVWSPTNAHADAADAKPSNTYATDAEATHIEYGRPPLGRQDWEQRHALDRT